MFFSFFFNLVLIAFTLGQSTLRCVMLLLFSRAHCVPIFQSSLHSFCALGLTAFTPG